MIKIAIAGNPNSGKTTAFNLLSGRNERVGNWAGVTVEKKEAKLRRKYNILQQPVMVVDLPGAYGMESYTNDEKEATEFLKKEQIDVIINIIDASNLERSLFFTMQLIDTGIPVVVALNKYDIVSRRKTEINIDKLGELLNTKVFFTQADRCKGLREVVACALEIASEVNVESERGNYGRKRFEKGSYKEHCFSGRGKKCRCKRTDNIR